jgi:hypothetical protein
MKTFFEKKSLEPRLSTTNYKDYYYKYKKELLRNSFARKAEERSSNKYYLKNNSIEKQKQIKGGMETNDNNDNNNENNDDYNIIPNNVNNYVPIDPNDNNGINIIPNNSEELVITSSEKKLPFLKDMYILKKKYDNNTNIGILNDQELQTLRKEEISIRELRRVFRNETTDSITKKIINKLNIHCTNIYNSQYSQITKDDIISEAELWINSKIDEESERNLRDSLKNSIENFRNDNITLSDYRKIKYTKIIKFFVSEK